MERLRAILSKGVPSKQTKETSEDMEFLKRFARDKIGKNVGCTWCNRHTLYRQLGEYLKAYDKQQSDEAIH
jgi:hypothetical protein